MIKAKSISTLLGVTLLVTAMPVVGLAQTAEPSAAPASTAPQGGNDIASVLAALEALSTRFDDLEARLAALEAPPSEPAAAPGKPKAPAKKGKVETEFPDWMRDEFRPAADRSEDRNREVAKWNDRSRNESGFKVYARRRFCEIRPGADPAQELAEKDFRDGRLDYVLIDELPADATRYQPDHEAINAALDAAPDSPYSNDEYYDIAVSSFNDAGESKTKLVASYYLTPEYRCP